MDSWMLIVIIFICGFLLIALIIALWNSKAQKKQREPQAQIPSAEELLALLKAKENDLNILKEYSKTACMFYDRYMGEVEDFDLKFIATLTSHKGTNAKLVLEIEKHFKQLNPARKALLDQALSIGLEHR